ncbi:MAG: PKD domain-containing protein [Promethearchaeota archaeon]
MASIKNMKRSTAALALIAITLATVVTTIPSNQNIVLYFELQANEITINAGDNVTFYIEQASGVAAFVWDFHDGTPPIQTQANTSSVSHEFRKPGYYTVTVVAMKNQMESLVKSQAIHVKPAFPDINVSIDKTIVYEDEPVCFSVNSTSAQHDSNVTLEFGDGTTGFVRVNNVTLHSYKNAGNYSIRSIYQTENGLEMTSYMSIKIINKPPSADFSTSNSNLTEDTLIQFNASTSNDTDSDKDDLIYIWDMGDDAIRSGAIINYSYPDEGIYNVTLTVIDDDGARDSKSEIVTVTNEAPHVIDIKASTTTPQEGQIFYYNATIQDSNSDLATMTFNWIGGSENGSIYSCSIDDDGTDPITLQVIDDNGASSNLHINSSVNASNVAPIVSLFNGSATYNITIRTWGTLNSSFNYVLYRNDMQYMNGTINCTQQNYTTNMPNATLVGLTQPLNEYWDMVANITPSESNFENWLEIKFTYGNNKSYTLLHRYYYQLPCCNKTWRVPINPLDYCFDVDLNFKVFDAGNDDITVFVDFGNVTNNNTLSRGASAPTEGIATVSGSIEDMQNIVFWAVDDDGGISATSKIILADIRDYFWNDSFLNTPQWYRWGHFIPYFIIEANLVMPLEAVTGEMLSFFAYPIQIATNESTLTYEWHFGDGGTSTKFYPSHSYQVSGPYRVYVIISDGNYYSVFSESINVSSQLPDIIASFTNDTTEGELVNFTCINSQNKVGLQYLWDFGDGFKAYDANVSHAYYQSGSYNASLLVLDEEGNAMILQDEIYVANQAPVLLLPINIISEPEGNTINFHAEVSDSPADVLGLIYSWEIDSIIYHQQSISISPVRGNHQGIFRVTDPGNATLSSNFEFVVSDSKPDVRISEFSFYGGANQVDVYCTLRKSINETCTIELSYEFANVSTKIPINSEIFTITLTGLGTLVSKDYSINATVLRDGNPVNSFTRTISMIFDRDGDFLTDEEETLYGTNPSLSDSNVNGQADPVEVLSNDTDTDGLSWYNEQYLGTDPDNNDTDGDGLLDGYDDRGLGESIQGTDPLNPDTDDDGINDSVEVIGWEIEVWGQSGLERFNVTSNPLINDTDLDGLSDRQEQYIGSNPNSIDTDGDGLNDSRELELGTRITAADSDDDGLTDKDEIDGYTITWFDTNDTEFNATIYPDPFSNDSDNDFLPDSDEMSIGLSATNNDTDFDGLSDYDEIMIYQTNPLDADSDGDKLMDGFELKGWTLPVLYVFGGSYDEFGNAIINPVSSTINITTRTDPNCVDTDHDGYTDYEELNGDNSTMSDPAAKDSDGDGIPDNIDNLKLVFDWEPPAIVSEPENYTISLDDVEQWIVNRSAFIPYYCNGTDWVAGMTTQDFIIDFITKELEVYGNTSQVILENYSLLNFTGYLDSIVVPPTEPNGSDYRRYFFTSLDLEGNARIIKEGHDIVVHYEGTAASIEETITDWLSNPLSNVWNAIKSASLFYKLVQIYLSKGYNGVKKYIKSKLISKIKSNVHRFLPQVGNWKKYYKSSLYLSKFGIKFDWRDPASTTVTGKFYMKVINTITTSKGYKNVRIDIDFITTDNAGIDRIDIYKDGTDKITIQGFGEKWVPVSTYFDLDGWVYTSIDPIDIRIEIRDINGNVRIVERTLNPVILDAEFLLTYQDLDILDEIDLPVETIQWVFDEIQGYLSGLAQPLYDFIDSIRYFLEEIYNNMTERMQSILRVILKKYMAVLKVSNVHHGKEFLIQMMEAFQSAPETISAPIDLIFNETWIDYALNESDPYLQQFREMIPDLSEDTFGMQGFFDGISQDLPVESIIASALSILEDVAVKIIQEVVMDTVKSMILSTIGNYGNALVEIAELVVNKTFDFFDVVLKKNLPQLNINLLTDPALSINQALDKFFNPRDMIKDMFNWTKSLIVDVFYLLFGGDASDPTTVSGTIVNILAPFLGLGLGITALMERAGELSYDTLNNIPEQMDYGPVDFLNESTRAVIGSILTQLCDLSDMISILVPEGPINVIRMVITGLMSGVGIIIDLWGWGPSLNLTENIEIAYSILNALGGLFKFISMGVKFSAKLFGSNENVKKTIKILQFAFAGLHFLTKTSVGIIFFVVANLIDDWRKNVFIFSGIVCILEPFLYVGKSVAQEFKLINDPRVGLSLFLGYGIVLVFDIIRQNRILVNQYHQYST